MKSPNRVDTHIGVRLRSLRAAKGLSQDDLAAAVGTTARQLQEWESGTKRVGSMNLRKISRLFGVDSEFFFAGALSLPADDVVRSDKALSSESVSLVDRRVEACARLLDDQKS